MVDCYNTPQILAPLSTSDHYILLIGNLSIVLQKKEIRLKLK